MEMECPCMYQTMETWMSDLPSKLTKIPLNELAIPGSHDSGAYYLDVNTPINPDEPKAIINLCRIFGSCGKSVVKRWSITQSLDITSQLKAGIRYFDIRSGYLTKQNDIFFVHGIYGHTIKSLLMQMKAFVDENPKEILLIDFNHFYSMTPDIHKRLANTIVEVFGEKIFPPNDKGMKNSLEDIWSTKKSVFIFYTNADICSVYKQFWHDAYIDSPWFNTSSLSYLQSQLNNRFNTLEPGCINIFQAILTPQTSSVVAHIAGSLKTTLALNCDCMVDQWLVNIATEKKTGVNVVILDFIEQKGCINNILALNQLLL